MEIQVNMLKKQFHLKELIWIDTQPHQSYAAFEPDVADKNVAVVAIEPNGLVGLSERGHDDLGDSPAEMKIRAEYRQFNFPYLYDGETQAVSRKYGPIATPHVYVFDEHRILRYQGHVDNNPREKLVTVRDARNAIDAVLAGRPVPVRPRW